MSYELRPLSLGELLDRAFSLYRRHFWLFVGIMALPSVVMLVVNLAVQLIQGLGSLERGNEAEFDPALLVALATGAVIILLGFIVYWVTYSIALGATTVAVSEIYLARTPTIAATYRATRGKIGRLVWLMFLIAIRVFGLAILMVFVVGLLTAMSAVVSPILSAFVVFVVMFGGFILVAWMFLRYAVAVPVAMLEDSAASDSIARSIDLTQGNLWRVLVLFGFTVIVTWVGIALFQAPFQVAAFAVGPDTVAAFWLNMVGVFTGSIANALTAPLAVVAMATLYYDLRVRKEGLDVELLLAGLRATPSTVPAATSSAVLPS